MVALQLSLNDGTYSNFPYIKMEIIFQSITILLKLRGLRWLNSRRYFQSITILLKHLVHRAFRAVIDCSPPIT